MPKTVDDLRRDYPHHVVISPIRVYRGLVVSLHDKFGGASWCEKRGSRTFGFETAEAADGFRAYWDAL